MDGGRSPSNSENSWTQQLKKLHSFEGQGWEPLLRLRSWMEPWRASRYSVYCCMGPSDLSISNFDASSLAKWSDDSISRIEQGRLVSWSIDF